MFFFLNCLHKNSNAVDLSDIILDNSIKLILVMNNYELLVGGNRFTITLNYSPTSSSFSNLIISSKRYGLTIGSFSTDKTKTVSITDLGKSIIAPTSNDNIYQLKMKALLQTKIYEKIFNNLNGKVIPSKNIIENDLTRMHDIPDKNKKDCCSIILKNIEELQLSKDVNGKKYLNLVSVRSNLSDNVNESSEEKDIQEINEPVDEFFL